MIVVTGASGLLGSRLVLAALTRGKEVTAISNRHPIAFPGVRNLVLDLETSGAGERLVQLNPEWIIHCAALTNVDRCQREPEAAARSNTLVPERLALAASRAGVRLFQVSTDAVFDGTREYYDEKAPPNPINIYGATKLYAEESVLAICPENIVARVNFFGQSVTGGRGLAEWILGELTAGHRVPGFCDSVFTPLCADDLADRILDLIDRQAAGLYHLCGGEAVTKFDFARALAEAFDLDPGLVFPATLAGSALAAPRPRTLYLRSTRAEKLLGAPMPNLALGLSRFRGSFQPG